MKLNRTRMLLVGLMLLTLAIIGVTLLLADTSPKYVPTEVQSLRLQNKQKDAQLAQMRLQQAGAQFQQALADLTAESVKVKTENHWPDAVQFNPDTLAFSEPPAPPAKKDGAK
jgi:hypothetical protein